MSDDDSWFRSQSAAAFGLVIKLIDRLMKLGVMKPRDARDLIDEFLLELEERQGVNPQLEPYYKATKAHLETMLAGMTGSRGE